MKNPILLPLLDNRGRLVHRATRQSLQQMTDEQLQEFRAYHVQTTYGGLVQAADDEIAWRQYSKANSTLETP